MSDHVSIRLAAREDRDVLWDIHVDSVRSLRLGFYTQDQIDRWFVGRSPGDYDAAIDYGGDRIAAIDDTPVAFIEFFSRTISMLYVRGAFAGRGIGRALMSHALATMPGRDGRIELEALGNAAPFYAKCGFRPVGHGAIRRASSLTIATILMERRFDR